MQVFPPSLCDFIRTFSISTYKQLSRFYSYRLGMSEIGITDMFILELIDFVNIQNLNRTVEIYKTTWKKESKYGNDIDLFIECENGQYAWYALQAKVMSYNGAYQDLKIKKGIQQWHKLLDHETKYSSKSYYLFYNGKSNIKPFTGTITKSDCIGFPDIDELGLGLVETGIVQRVVTGNKYPTGQIYMRHFVPDKMDSLRKLFCCPNQCDTLNKLYEYEDIYKGAPYEKINNKETSDGDNKDLLSEKEIVMTKETEGIAPLRIIVSKTK